MPDSPDELIELWTAAQEAAVAPRLALLIFAAEQAMATLPSDPAQQEARRALDLAARLAAGEPVDPDAIEAALLRDDHGLLVSEQSAPEGPQAEAWTAITGVLGYAAWQGFRHRGEPIGPVVEEFSRDDALDYVVAQFARVSGMDWRKVAAAAAHVQGAGARAAEGWGVPLKLSDLRSLPT